MILYLDERGCVTDMSNAKRVLFGVPDWVFMDIREYGTRYCCRYIYEAERVKWGGLMCEGMGGARVFTVDTFWCIDGRGRGFVLNRDDVAGIVKPLVCVRQRLKTTSTVEANYRYMLNIAKKIKCRGHCVVDERGEVVVFGSDLLTVLDSWATLMRRRDITMWSVLV
jgi:hypothetical protein